jgi:hypothetical protein
MTNSIRLLVALGWALRLFHFLRDPSVWHDEAALIVNVLRHDFGELLGPLLWNEAAPPLFLWLERALVMLLGDSTFALRLLPLLASCATLPLVAVTAARRLPPRGAFWAVLLVAVSDRLLWHACEAKPYSLDVFIAALMLFAYDRTTLWSLNRRLFALMVISPLVIFLSYPACCLCGGFWLTLVVGQPLPLACAAGSLGSPQRKQGEAAGSLGHATLFLSCASVIGTAFLLLYLGPIRAQRTGPMEGCWLTHFPNWSRPWTLPWWSLMSTLEVLRYNFKPLGALYVGFVVVGGVTTWRRDRAWLVLLLAPLGLAWLGSVVGGYPYGGSRLEVFATPALALLIGAGIDPLRNWLAPPARWGYAIGIVPLLLLPLAFTVQNLVIPWPRVDASGASRFIRERKQPGEPVVANHWEYVYYFRDCPDEFWLDAPLPSAPRLWVSVTAQDDAEREAMIADFARRRRVVERRDFMFTTVLLLEQTDPAVAQR